VAFEVVFERCQVGGHFLGCFAADDEWDEQFADAAACSNRRTAPSPAQARSPSASWSASS
jgi:hypothetical protein